MIYKPTTRAEELVAEALITATCLDKDFPTRDTHYTARIHTRGRGQWNTGKLAATLDISGDSGDLMDGDAFPIFLWIDVQEAIAGTGFADRVTICWELPGNAWLNDPQGLSERWPVTPGPFLWNPNTAKAK